MAIDMLVDSTELDNGLTTIADAIRAKGGTSALLAFPNGMAQAVEDIPTGITPSGKKLITDTSETDVTAFATAQVSSNTLLSENIKKNINILGIVGSFEGGGGIVGKALTLVDTFEETRTTALNAKMSNVFIDYCNGNDATDNHLYIGNVKYPSGVSPTGYDVVFFILWQLSETEQNATNQRYTIYAHKRYGESINLINNQSNWLAAAAGQSAVIPVGATVRVDKYTVNL